MDAYEHIFLQENGLTQLAARFVALLRERLKKLNISVMTPLEALNLLDDLKKMV